MCIFFFSSRRRHTRCALVTGVQTCALPISMADVHADPDRLDAPLRRRPYGTWESQSWDDAMAEVGSRLAAVIEAHGPSAVAVYTGNPLAFNALGQATAGSLARGLGVRRSFSSGTQYCANKFTASEAVYGSYTIHPIPDLAGTDLCLVVGDNPRLSQS